MEFSIDLFAAGGGAVHSIKSGHKQFSVNQEVLAA
jgi:hypothetical protein